MSEIKEKLKELKSDKKKLIITLIGLFALGFLLFSSGQSNDTGDVPREENTGVYAAEYTEKEEKELESLLRQINGVGKVSVMITLENTYENVFAKSYATNIQQRENETKEETDEEYIIVKKGSNNEQSLLVKVYEPKVKGVAVVAEGAGNINVKEAVTETVCALYNISSAKVSVVSS